VISSYIIRDPQDRNTVDLRNFLAVHCTLARICSGCCETNGINMNITEDPVISEYVVISNEEISQLVCSCAEFESVSDVEAMKIMLQDEMKKNKRFLQKLKDLSKKYRKAVKRIEYQELLISELSNALKNEQENVKNGLFHEDLSEIAYGSLKIEECEEQVR